MLEKLKELTKIDSENIERALDKNQNKFWETLYDLFKPEHSKSHYLAELKDSIQRLDKPKIIELLSTITSFYFNEKYIEVEVGIMFCDKPLYEKLGPPPVFELAPEPNEFELYLQILSTNTFDQEIVIKTLKAIKWIRLPDKDIHFENTLSSLIRSEDWKISESALKAITDRPEYTDRFLSDIRFNLTDARDMNHFDAVRVLWCEKTPIYKEIVPEIIELMESTSHTQLPSLCSNILERYGVVSKEEMKEKAIKKREEQIDFIQMEIKNITNSEELHEFADGFNWDDDFEYIKAITKHPKCEIATAKLVYWRSRPFFFLQYEDLNEVPDYHKKSFELQRTIEERLKTGKYPIGDIQWNPKEDAEFNLTEDLYSEIEKKRTIPQNMY